MVEHPRLFGAAAVVLLALTAPAQRDVTQITTTGVPHQDPKISPDGQTIAFRGPGKIGSANFLGGPEGTMVVGNNLGDFIWSPGGAGIYFIEDSDFKFVSRSGGNGLRLAGLPGQGHRLWCVDSQDKTVWGTRFEPTTNTYHIFTVPTGGAAPVDIVTSSLLLDQVRIDPTDSQIVFRESVATPFSPVELFAANPDGTNQVSLTGGMITGCPDHVDWIDNGQTVAFSIQSLVTGQPQLASVDASTQIDMLTEGTRQRGNLTVSPDKQWLVHHSQYVVGSATSSATVAILPATGGGQIHLTWDNRTYLLHGPPTIDGFSRRIAFAATFVTPEGVGLFVPQIFTATLDRELRISPRAELGQSFQVTMPIRTNEIGAVFISAAVTPFFKLPGFTGGLAVSAPLTLISGSSASGSLGVSINVPNVGAIVGLSVFLQGLRVITLSQGDFTRFAEVRIF